MNANGVTFVLDASNSTCDAYTAPVMPMSADSLTQTEVGTPSVLVDSRMLDGVNLSGTITLDLSAWQIQNGDTVMLTFAENMSFAEGATIQATFDNGATFVQADAVSGNAAQFSASKAIPEPTTVTLSLLALAGLAARRRRTGGPAARQR